MTEIKCFFPVSDKKGGKKKRGGGGEGNNDGGGLFPLKATLLPSLLVCLSGRIEGGKKDQAVEIADMSPFDPPANK